MLLESLQIAAVPCNVSLGLKFDSEVAQASRGFAGKGIVRYAW